MTRRFAVIWRGKSAVAFFDGSGWSVDACEAKSFPSMVTARRAVGFMSGTHVVPCWV